MVLLTTTSMNHLVENGTFLLNQVNENPGVTLALYYVLPRCLMAMSFVYVSNIVNQVIRKSLKNAMKMEEKAATDEMTGLYNKNKLLATIEKRTYDYQQVAIVYWDINRLKYVNDTYGHFAGDQMIVKVAQSIRIALGDAGMAFRYGGDEMLALIPGGTGETYKGYKEEGYLPEAFVNFLALLGWSPSDDKEILSLEEMAAEFDLHKVHKAGARFSKEKAEWFNHQYLQKQSNEELLESFKNLEETKNINLSDEKLLKIIGLMKERATFVKDIYTQGKFFFEAPASYDEKAVKKAWNEETASIMTELSEKLNTTEFKSEILKEEIHHLVEEKGLGFGKVMMPLRLALVGELKGPDVPDLLEILGKEESLTRLKLAIEKIK
jgi:GGDEF domain-containing protein